MKVAFFLILFFGSLLSSDDLLNAVKSELRDPNNFSRDSYRNPYETLSFF